MPYRSASPFLVVPLLILLGDWLLWDASPGIGLSLWLLAIGALMAWRFPALRNNFAGMGSLCAVCLGALAGIVDQGLLPAGYALIGLLAAAVIGRTNDVPDAVTLLERAAAGIFGLISRPFADSRLAVRWRRGRGRAPSRVAGWLMPLAFGGLFAGLFWIANPVIGARIADLANWLIDLTNLPAPLRVLWWWLSGMGLWLLLRGRWPTWWQSNHREASNIRRIPLVQRSLLIFNGLFILQNGCDIVYLWGGVTLPDGMTYAAYAHRGAYPLIATALLAAIFVLAWFRPGSAVQVTPWCRRLVLLWLAQNVALLISALWRLHLYVDIYDLTRWRVAAAVWMVLVAIGLGLITWRIRQHLSNRWLVNANLTTLAAVLLVLAWCDVDGAIASHNVTHGGTHIDYEYIVSLGPAALPALRRQAASGDRTAAQAVHDLTQQLTLDNADFPISPLALPQAPERTTGAPTTSSGYTQVCSRPCPWPRANDWGPYDELRLYTSLLEAMPMASSERLGPQRRTPVIHKFARGHAHGLARTTGAPAPVIP
jgi:hypothetical protein